MPNDHAEAQSAISARYGADTPETGQWNDTIGLLINHRSVRAYTADPLPEGTLDTIAAAAQSAATSSNLQTWSMLAVQDTALKAELAKLANNQKQILEAPLQLLFLADLSRAARMGEAQGRTMEALPYTEAAMLAMIDAALAAQNATIAAESLGLGTCYIGSMRNHPEAIAELLGLPPLCFAVFGLCVGWPDPARASPIRPRLPREVVLHHERYSPSAEEAGIAAYEARMADYQGRAGMTQIGWTPRVFDRLAVAKGLGERTRMKDALTARGFPLK